MNAGRAVLTILRLALLLLAVAAHGDAMVPAAELNIVPRPAKYRALPGVFLLTGATRIVATDEESRRIAGLFNDFLLEQHGLKLEIISVRPRTANYLLFSRAGADDSKPEGYHLAISAESIRVTGTAAGLFYGMQTLTQLLPVKLGTSIELPAMDIEDQPRFGYRGVLLDVGRHYFSVAFIKKFLDLAAQYKINRFHWHLTDDQGWRIEIKRYPKLTGTDAAVSGGDAQFVGFYTQEQIKDIVAYARARFITVVPEIEMPGHSGAALAAYPERGCAPFDQAVAFCPKQETFTFLENVLSEVIALFPGPYVHIGSDEVEKEAWRRSPEAQAIIAREGLKDVDELQSYFARRIERFVTSRGKRMIGWDEILQGGLPPQTIVMSWRGEEGGIEAARQNHEVIMTPSEYTYFDYYQGDARLEPLSIGGFIPLEKAYAYEPVPKQIAKDQEKFILGAQAQLWTEYVATPEHAEYMMFPRVLAFAEAVWSPVAGRNYDDFRRRLPYQLGRLDKQDVRYRIPEPEGLEDFYTTTQDHAVVALSPPIPAAQMFYTLDGSEPSDASTLYRAPLQIALRPEQPEVLKLVVVSPQGRRSVVYGATFLRRAFLAPTRVEAQPKLSFVLYDGKFAGVRDIERGAKVAKGTTESFDLQQFGRFLNFAVQFEGFLKIDSDDFYMFVVDSDDGAVLEIDDEVVVDNDGNHAPRTIAGHVPLRRGLHKFRLRYFQSEGGSSFGVSWAKSDGTLQPLEGSALYH
jgi:hexosaminidase